MILLVEDNDDDRELAVLAFKQAGAPGRLLTAADGEQALELLFSADRDAQQANAIKLVLLDLKLPKVDGLQVLRRIRADPRTCYLPVVILTSSLERTDLVEGYRLGANSYLRKPVNFLEFVELAGHLGNYWLRFNQIPPAHAA